MVGPEGLPNSKKISSLTPSLGENDKVTLDFLGKEPLGVWLGGVVVLDLVRARKCRDDRWIALFKIPQVVNVSVAEDHEASILRAGVFACLLLADARIFVLGFRFEDNERLAVLVQQQEVDEAVRALFEALAKVLDVLCSGFSFTFGSRTTFAGPFASSKKRQPAASSSRLILILAVASLRNDNAHPPAKFSSESIFQTR